MSTILVVEDDSAVRTLLRLILSEWGHSVIEAGDGLEAAEVIAARHPELDLILTDVRMPNMDGCELRDWTAANYPRLKLVVMSGYAENSVENTPLLRKPFNKKSLGAFLGKVLA